MHARVAHLLWLNRRSHADHPWAALVPWLLPAEYIAAQAAALCTPALSHTSGALISLRKCIHKLVCLAPSKPHTWSWGSATRHGQCLHKPL